MGEEGPKLLDLMLQNTSSPPPPPPRPRPRQSILSTTTCDEKKLELRLGLPCQEYGYHNKQNHQENNNQPFISFSHSQKRSAPTPVVGWPPIRSFRKNLASSSSAKMGAEPQSVIPSKPVNEKRPAENSNKGLFVKINMDGVPIGRKVDLSAYNCYENLSSAVDTLFRGLLTALKDSSAGGTENKQEDQKPITGLLDGTGEYTLVYEDTEGDRMLVGDVPWQMFVSTVKRLRVLKTSDLPTLSRGSKQGKTMLERR
ncbi:hypothetical protein vseg_007272 [Gypsophila vaccaria]